MADGCADGCVVKHKIECIGNSDGTFHFEAGAPVRQIGNRTIDQRLMAFKDDARSLESAVARFISALLLRVIHCSFFRPYAPRCFPWPSSLGGRPCAKRVESRMQKLRENRPGNWDDAARAEALTWGARSGAAPSG
jgi:hypothetical protein